MTTKMPQATHQMTGNVQGFELPRGCLMTTGVILVVITGLIAGLLLI